MELPTESVDHVFSPLACLMHFSPHIMRITIHAEGFNSTPQLRAAVESRLFAALRSFHDRIRLVAVHLETRVGRDQPDTVSCGIVVNLHPTGEIRVRAETQQMLVSVDRAARAIRAEIQRERVQAAPPPGSPRVASPPSSGDALEIVLEDGRISQLERETLERPENYLRPVPVREYWKPSGADDHESPDKLENAFGGNRSRSQTALISR
jgi:ribosome-associated translation inhibitor RaiA